MGELFSVASATTILTDIVTDLQTYVVLVLGLVAGFVIAKRWFKAGVGMVASGRVR